MRKKKWSRIAFVFYMIFSFVLTGIMPVSAYTTYQYLGSVKDYQGAYGSAQVGNFLVDGRRAFCLEHNLPTPPNGSSFIEETYYNERFKKALYYGYEGVEPWGGFKSKENGIVVTTLALSVIYSGWDSIGGQNQGNKELGVNAFLNYIDSKTLKNKSIAFEPENVKARLEKNHQVTQSLTLKGDNEVSFTLPKDVTMIKSGQRYTNQVTIKGGESFYFEAPLTVTGKFESGVLKGKMADYQPIVLRNKNQKLQDLGTLKIIKDPGFTASFSVDWLSAGSLLIKKVDEYNQPVQNVTFNVSYQQDMGNSIGKYTTNEKGELAVPNLKPGLVYLQEIEAPNHLLIDSGVFSCLIEAGKQTIFTKENQIKKGRLKIHKKDASNKQHILSNVSFEICRDDQVIETVRTDETGIAISSLLPYGKYDVIELDPPHDYWWNGEKHPAIISENDSIVEIVVYDQRREGSIEINKDYIYPIQGHGDAKLYGAKYSLYAASDLYNPCTKELLYKKDEIISIKDYWGDVGEKEVDKEGHISWNHLILGDYYVKETQAPEGFLIDENKYFFNLKEYERSKIANEKQSVKDFIMMQKIGILKISANDTSGQSEVIPNVEFEVKLKSDIEKFGYEKAPLYTHLVTDEKGWTSCSLPYGIYNVRELKTREDLQKCEDFELIVDHHSTEVEIVKIINNAPYKAYVKIVKKDEKTGKVIQLEGVSFKIRDVKNDCFVEQQVGDRIIDTFVTNQLGQVTTPLPLKSGKYEIVEIKAPQNYVILDHSIPFSITNVTNQNQEEAIVEVEVKNQPIQGQISIYKEGEVVEGFDKTFRYVKRPLEGAEFVIKSKNAILDPADGKTVLYKAGQTVERLTTDQNGTAKSSLLPLGTYVLEEIKAPEGFELDTKSYEAVLQATNNKEEIIYSHHKLENVRKKMSIEIEKQDAVTKKALDNAEFGLYANENIEGIFQKGELLEILKTKNGKAKVSLDLPIASYYIKEIKAPEGYISTHDMWQIDGHLDIHYTRTFLNEQTKMYVTKLDAETKKPLAGAKLQISDLEGHIIDTWVSTTSKHVIKGLEIGKKYKIEELESPDGYSLTNSKEFVMEGHEMKVEMENKRIEGTVMIRKKGLIYSGLENNQLTYHLKDLDEVEFGLFNKEGVLLAKKSTKEGKVTFSGLMAGEYYIQELKTKDGMVMDTTKHHFTVGKETEFEFECINKRTQIQLSLRKILASQNETHKESYKDVEFGIYTNESIQNLPKDTLVGTSKINLQGHLLETFYLESGEYYLKEIKTHPDYVLDENKYVFNVDLKNFNQEKQTIVINNGNVIENNLKEGSIIIEKKDKQTKEYLSGAIFSVCDLYGFEWARVVTDENGIAQIPCIYGKYKLREIEAPKGYKLDSKEYEIVINDQNQIVKIELFNEKKSVVESGDHTNGYIYLLLGVSSLFIIYFLFKKRSKMM